MYVFQQSGEQEARRFAGAPCGRSKNTANKKHNGAVAMRRPVGHAMVVRRAHGERESSDMYMLHLVC